jgi:vacuolar-type H+-ATPase subunit H
MPNQKNQMTREGATSGKDFVPMPTQTQKAQSGDATARGKELLDQAKSTANEAYDKFAEKATSTIEEQKTDLAGGLTSVADSFRKTGDSLNTGQSQNYVTEYSAHYVKTAADKLEGVARYFETSDVKTMARDVESYARRNPAIFLGGAFVLGVLAARFFKSSPLPAMEQNSTPTEQKFEQGNFESARF